MEFEPNRELPNREEFAGDANMSDGSDHDDDVPFVDIPREVETEHMVVNKCTVDGKNLCSGCVLTYCRRNRIDKFESHFIHNVLTMQRAREAYEIHKCEICSIGLMRMLGKSNCIICCCAACDALKFLERCVQCQRARIKLSVQVKEVSMEGNNFND